MFLSRVVFIEVYLMLYSLHMSHTVFITGAAGYIGGMLADQFSKRPDVAHIVCLDREDKPTLLERNEKIIWVKAYTSDDTWQSIVKGYNPDIVIHTAWQIRELYGKQDVQWKWNVTGTDKVFDFVFTTTSVKRFVHFSTVSSYSALPENKLDDVFTEDKPFRDSPYLYATEKKVVEDRLKLRYEKAIQEGVVTPQISIIRPASITGPRGRSRSKLNLQSALSGKLKDTPTHRFLSSMLAWMPITPKWCRQFVHEDDICDATELLAFGNTQHRYEAYNICPEGPIVLGKDMAAAVGKKTIMLEPWMIRIVFFFAWHVTQGGIPTSRGGWMTYSFPIVVDGKKISKDYGYTYKMGPFDAFTKQEGRYKHVTLQTHQ
jgi:nucleoside-diphosphate-sugar epimerase